MQVVKSSRRLLTSPFPFGKLSFKTRFYINCLPTCSDVQANQQLSLANTFKKSFSQNRQFEKITSYENLNHRISGAGSINDLMKTCEQNLILFKPENIAISLRTLAFLTKPNLTNQIESLAQDKRYIALMHKVEENISNFKEEDLSFIFLWLRKFKAYNMNTTLSDETINKLAKRTDEYVKAQSYSFKNLPSLFHSLSYLDKSTDEVCTALLREMKNTENKLTAGMIIQILEGCYFYNKGMYYKEAMLIETVQKSVYPQLQEISREQRCTIFKYLCLLELHLNPIRFRIPPILYTLKNVLKDNIDSLQEKDILKILEGYEQLPREFPNDLLDEIKELVLVTLQHNSSSVKSYFLIDFLDKMTPFEGYRRIPQNKILVIYEELIKRIPVDGFFSKYRNLEKVVEIYDKNGIDYPSLIDKVYQKVLGFSDSTFSGPVLQCFNNHNLNIMPILDNYLGNLNPKSIGNYQAVKIFIVLSGLKTNKYQALKDTLKSKFLSNPHETHKYITLIVNSEIKNTDIDEVLKTMIATLKNSRGTISDMTFYKGMIQSTTTREIRQEWRVWAQEHLANLDSTQLQKLTDAVFSNPDLMHGQVLLYTYILFLNQPQNIPFKKLMYGLRDNKQFITELAKGETMFRKFLDQLRVYMNANKDQVRLTVVFGVVRNLESLGLKFKTTTSLLRKAYKICKEAKVNNPMPIEVVITLYLLNNKALDLKDAQAFYNEWKENLSDVSLTSKYLSYILQKSSEALSQDEKTIQETNEMLEVLYRNLSETSPKVVISALTSIIAFPPSFLESNKEYLVKTTKEFIGLGTSSLYLELLSAVPVSYFRKHLDFYVPFLKELANHYDSFKKRMSVHEIIKTLKRFTDFNYKSPELYKSIVADISKHIHYLKNEEYSMVVTAFAKMSQNRPELFDKIVAKIVSDPYSFSMYLKGFILNFFRVGYNSHFAKTNIPNIFSNLGSSLTSDSRVAFFCYIPLLNLSPEAELELLERHVSSLKIKEPHYFLSPLNYTYEFLKIVYKHKPHLAEKINNLRANITHSTNEGQSKSLAKAQKTVGDYLKAMNAEYEVDFTIGDYKVDLFVPSQNVIIKIFQKNDLNFDKASLTGKGKLTKRIYQSFSDYKPVFINLEELQKIPNHINKISHLSEKGVQNNNIRGIYDFSHIEKEHKVEGHPEEIEKDDVGQEVEDEIEDEEKLDRKDEDIEDIQLAFHHDLKSKKYYKNPDF